MFKFIALILKWNENKFRTWYVSRKDCLKNRKDKIRQVENKSFIRSSKKRKEK